MNNREDAKQEGLRVAYVTHEEKTEAKKIENKTLAELQQIIFELIHNLPTEMQDIMEDILKRKVKNKQKKEHNTFLYELLELTLIQ